MANEVSTITVGSVLTISRLHKIDDKPKPGVVTREILASWLKAEGKYALTPIDTTTEWLEKAGFEFIDNYWRLEVGDVTLLVSSNDMSIAIEQERNQQATPYISTIYPQVFVEHVHILQNLCAVLEGKPFFIPL